MRLRHFAPLIWLVGITYLSTAHVSALPSIRFEASDKVGHFGAYALLGGLMYWSWRPEKAYSRRFVWICVLIGGGYGVFMEWVQGTFFPNRAFEYYDMLANLLGALTGTLAMAWWVHRKD
jgi:VanZ family protein